MMLVFVNGPSLCEEVREGTESYVVAGLTLCGVNKQWNSANSRSPRLFTHANTKQARARVAFDIVFWKHFWKKFKKLFFVLL